MTKLFSLTLLASSALVCAPLASAQAATAQTPIAQSPSTGDSQEPRDSGAALEQRIAELEARLAQLTKASVPELTVPESNANANPSSNANSFNPAISLLLSGTYARRDDVDFVIDGFSAGEEAGPPEQGFALGESELTLSAAIDDKFFGQMTVAFANEDGETISEMEEAFIETSALADGATLRFGRFLSGVGYLNSHHAHTDSFIDRPLVYGAFFNHHYGDDGVQLRYLLPTNLFVEVGAELLRGESYPAANAGDKGVGTKTQFIHVGDDIGSGGSYLLGYSHLGATAQERAFDEDGNFFSGDTDLNMLDATFKWSPAGNRKRGALTLRTEYFQERIDGQLNVEGDVQDWAGRRSGYYLEAAYLFEQRWELGLRFDRLKPDAEAPAIFFANGQASSFAAQRQSLLLAWRNSEFSRLQWQYSHGELQDGEADRGWFLQYQMALGAHAAHKY